MKHKQEINAPVMGEDCTSDKSQLNQPPLLFGPSVLYLAGMTTQVPAQPCVVVLGEGSPKHIGGQYVFFRDQAWFDRIQKEIHASGEGALAEMGSYGLRYLSPRMSLIESWVSADCWQPQSDDLDLDEEEIAKILAFAQEHGEPYASTTALIFNKAKGFKSPRI